MTSRRPHPFDLVFAGCRVQRYPEIRAALGPRSDLDSFMLAAPALELMHELRPDEGLGEVAGDFAMLLHAAFLFWRDGEETVILDERATRALCRPPDDDTLSLGGELAVVTRYIQLEPRVIWAQLGDAAPFEPLDGWFAVPVESGLRVVGCFGIHPERPGISVAVVEGPARSNVAREDGSPLFAPTMTGGDTAQLHAVVRPDELLLLGWRGAAISLEMSRWR